MITVQCAASCADQTLGQVLSDLLSHRHRNQHAARKLPGLTNGARKATSQIPFSQKRKDVLPKKVYWIDNL